MYHFCLLSIDRYLTIWLFYRGRNLIHLLSSGEKKLFWKFLLGDEILYQPCGNTSVMIAQFGELSPRWTRCINTVPTWTGGGFFSAEV